MFGPEFSFRDENQRTITNDIYMGNLPFRVVHVPTGYSKTEMFHLPLFALASKKDSMYVSLSLYHIPSFWRIQ